MLKPLLLLMMVILWTAAGLDDYIPSHDIASFLHERANWQPLCLYTFDDSAIGNGSKVLNRVPNEVCPFDALQAEKELVTSLNTKSDFWQLGVHLTEDPTKDSKRQQLSSISTVSARDFFTMAAVSNKSDSKAGMTFEMVIRPCSTTNHSMTLFSIANEYDNCVDPGFRLDVNENGVLVFIYFLPVLEQGGEAGVEACYEQRLFSVDNSAVCQLPPVLNPVERTPPVQIIVTLDPSSERGLWKTDFYMSYTDAETMQRVDCVVHDEQHPPNSQLLNKLIEGRYRLYLGNSPRNVTSPRKRKRLAKVRDIPILGNTSNLNATERLRFKLKQKLMSITGPRLPKAMRIFGDNSVSLKILGITFPPLSEDTPLAFLRSKLANFKEQYGDKIVDYLVNVVQQKSRNSVAVKRLQQFNSQNDDLVSEFDQISGGKDEFTRTSLFQGADGATFDLFHFAIYQRVVSADEVNLTGRKWLLPSHQFPSLKQTVRIQEDSLVLLNLTMLHGVFNDLRLELRSLPEFGQLQLFPNKTIVKFENKDEFRDLPVEFQHSIFFRPEPDQNNDNLPLPNSVAFSRRLKPYATIRFGIAESFSMRDVNKSQEAQIHIFVDPVNDAPRPRKLKVEIGVGRNVPVHLNLTGDDIDGAPGTTTSNSEASDENDFLSKFSFTNTSVETMTYQLLKIVKLPRFGKLFDCNKSCSTLAFEWNNNLESVELSRVFQNSTDVANATHSTNLMYVYRGWGQNNHSQNGDELGVVDELWYQLSDKDPGVFSDIAVVSFVLSSGNEDDSDSGNVLTTIRLDEDSRQEINLGVLDPLTAFINRRTRFKVTILPQHGFLYQSSSENDTHVASSVPLVSIGGQITTANTVVADPLGRVIYVPALDYFNLGTPAAFQRASNADYFEYQVFNFTQPTSAKLDLNANSPSARFVNDSNVRRVLLEVVNVPDTLFVLLPFTFISNLSSMTESTPTPIAFEDPDKTDPNQLYQVNLEAVDSTSKFEFGFAISDDDIMTECPLERPCTLTRSTNGTCLNMSTKSIQDSELQFFITTQLYDASHIQIRGSKRALNTALAALSFRDFSGISPSIGHIAEFSLWVKRVDFGNESEVNALETKTMFTINFPANRPSENLSNEDLLSVVNSKLEQSISTFFVLIAGWLVLSNASWISTGFCCCCCSKVRKKRREKFEQEQLLFQAQVAQNDYEYSVLLKSLADMLLEPNLIVSITLLECVTSKCHQTQNELLTQALILRSLLPLLESERQGTRFVFQLMAIEHSKRSAKKQSNLLSYHEDFFSKSCTASKALACFCRLVGNKWLSAVLYKTRNDTLGDTITKLDMLFDRLSEQIKSLPPEIVILSRACVKLLQEDAESHELQLAAVHLVFFNHFLGPALLFSQDFAPECKPSFEQQKMLHNMAYEIVRFSGHWNIYDKKEDALQSRRSSSNMTFSHESWRVAACRYKYEELLEALSQSPAMASAYDPNDLEVEVDCELMGMSLMNIHSLLDAYFPEFKRELQSQPSFNADRIEATTPRLTRLLKSLSRPLATIHELVEYAQVELVNDPLLWNDLSFLQWEIRAQQHEKRYQLNSLSPSGSERLQSLLSDCILENDVNSPRDVDWITS